MMSIEGTRLLDTGSKIKESIAHLDIDSYVTHLEGPNGPISIPPPGVRAKWWWNPLTESAAAEKGAVWVLSEGILFEIHPRVHD